jgi:hypothetical protein
MMPWESNRQIRESMDEELIYALCMKDGEP